MLEPRLDAIKRAVPTADCSLASAPVERKVLISSTLSVTASSRM